MSMAVATIEERRVPAEARTRKAPTKPKSVNEQARTVDVVVSTGAQVERSSWMDGPYVESLQIDAKSVRLDWMNGGRAPLLDSHMRWSVESVLGVVERAWIEGGELLARIRFAEGAAAADEAFAKVRQGIVGAVSVGYRVYRYEETKAEPTKGKPRELRATDWEPTEISLVPIPADQGAGVRSAPEPNDCLVITRAEGPTTQERTMTVAGAADPAAETTSAERTSPAGNPGGTVIEQTRAAPGGDATVDQVRAEERTRISQIQDLGRRARLSAEEIQRHIEAGTSVGSFRQVALELMLARDATQPDTRSALPGAPAVVHRWPERDRGVMAASIVRAIASTRNNVQMAIERARAVGDEMLVRAMTAGVLADGGFLVPEQYSSELIELLRPMSVVRSFGPRFMPMPNGNMTIPKQTGGATAGYVGEGEERNASQPSGGQVKLTARKLLSHVPISNDLIRFSSPQADVMVRDDLLAVLATTEDLNFLTGLGTGNGPKGLRYWAAPANILTMTGTPDRTKIASDLGLMQLALENSNVRFIKPGWIMTPSIKLCLMQLLDGNGNYIYRAEMLTGSLNGYPYKVTSQLSQLLFLVDFADVVIGDVPGIIIEASSEASYRDSSGTLVSAFSRDETVIRAIAQHDQVVRHAESIAVLTGTTWAPGAPAT